VPLKIGLVGSRSWLAPHFIRELEARDHTVNIVFKGDVPYENLRKFDVVVLIAGRARPTQEEMSAEERLCKAITQHKNPPRHVLYISSCAVDRWERNSRPLSREGEMYVLGKKRCESAVIGGLNKNYAIRLPVIFGSGQSRDVDMLVPMTAKSLGLGLPIFMRTPMEPFELVHAGQAAAAVADFVYDIYWGDPLPILSVRSDLHTPLRLVSVMAPGHPVQFAQGWKYTDPHKKWGEYDRERGQHHIREVTFSLKDQDLIDTMAWYEQHPEQLTDGSFEGALLLPEGDVIDV
jgi:hypothetical protein